MIAIADLQQQSRWVLWRLEEVRGKQTKVPYQISGAKARTNDPSTWSTYDECSAAVSKFSGIGLVLGEVDGVSIVGIDLDKCCDAVTGKFSPESREVVIALDSYAEYSPSGDGAHVLLIGKISGDGSPIVKPYPGCKQIEIKGQKADGHRFYFTFTERHLSKTQSALMDRQAQLDALCERVRSISPRKGLIVSIPQDEDARFKKLWAGDMSDYEEDHSRADLALVGILARRFNNNPFLIDAEFMKSGLYREKWDRLDYKWGTIGRVIKGEPVFDAEEDIIEDDGVDEYVLEPLQGRRGDGWFPCGDVSVIGGGSGTGKTYFVMDLLENARLGKEVWGHRTIPKDYRVLLHDRGAASMRRTLAALGLSAEARQRVIRLSARQQSKSPGEVLEAACAANPGARVWFIEGLDMWSPNANKMEVISPMVDALQRVATRRKIAVLASVGAGKVKTTEGRDTERYRGRDALFGSSALARKTETVILMSEHDKESPDYNPRLVCVYPRIGKMELFWIDVDEAGKLHKVDAPEPKEQGHKGPPSKAGLVRLNVFAKFKPGERILYSPDLGVAEKTYYAWLKTAVAEGLIEHREGFRGGYFIPSREEAKRHTA